MYILPGMGADSSMYGKQFRSIQSVQYIEWPVYCNEQSIEDVALRIIDEYHIRSTDFVGGSSLGGIVAAEIARHVSIRKLLLIGSTLTPKSINPVLQKLSALSDITPVRLMQILAGTSNKIFNSHIIQMLSQTEPLFIKAMCKAVFDWPGNQLPICPVAHIHGAKDRVIIPPANGVEIIPDAGHLIAITHEQYVIQFLQQETCLSEGFN